MDQIGYSETLKPTRQTHISAAAMPTGCSGNPQLHNLLTGRRVSILLHFANMSADSVYGIAYTCVYSSLLPLFSSPDLFRPI